MTHPTRILIVDGAHRAAARWHETLSSRGDVEVRAADSIVQAVARTTGERFDVVLVHREVVEGEGISAVEQFTASLPDLPVVLVTPCADHRLVRDAVHAGVVDVVVEGTSDERDVLRIVLDAVERGRLRREVEDLRRRHRALVDLGRATAARPPLPDLLATAASLVCEALDARVALVLRDRADGTWVVQAAVGVAQGVTGEAVPQSLRGGLDRAGCEPRLVSEPCAAELPGEAAELRSTRNSLVLPLRGSVWTGALVLLDTSAGTDEVELVDFGTAVQSLLSEALHRSEAEFDLRERMKELTALAMIGRRVQEWTHDGVLETVAQALVTGMQFPDRAVAVLQVDDDVVVSDGGSPVLAEALTAPLSTGGTSRGHVTVGHRDQQGFLPEFEQQFVDSAAETISLWIAARDQLRRAQEREARLQSVLEQVPGIVWVVDTDLVIAGHAGRGHEQISLEPDERAGRRLDVLLGEDHDATVAVRRALAGQATTYDSCLEDRWFETRVEPLRGPDRDVIGAIAVAVDVTDARQAQEELDASRRRLQGLFTSAHDAFLLVDDDGRFVDANPAAAKLTGYCPEELQQMGVTDLAPGVADEEVAGLLRELRAVGQMEGTWLLVQPDGSQNIAEYRVVSDVVPGIHLVVLTDVTARDQAMAALRQSEERFRRLADNAQDVIYRLDVTGPPRFDYVSTAVEEMVGCTVEQLYADPALPVGMLAPEDADRLLRCVTGPRDAPAPFVAEVRRPDGRTIWVEERHGYVFDEDGRHVATEGLVRDITARKRIEQELRHGLEREHAAAEELRELNAMKDVFLSAVSHELRTPLTSLKGMSHTLREQFGKLDDDTVQLLLERLSANADRLTRLLDDVFDIDRLTRGAELLDMREADVAEIVSRTLDQLTEHHHPIRTSLRPVRAVVDDAKLERVVENLVANALRHTEEGVPIWIGLDEDGDDVVLTVEDAGPGVPEHLRDRIFEPFEMGDTPASRVGGLGIGLSLVAKFTELHGGEVTVGDREGGGACFRVRLPRSPCP